MRGRHDLIKRRERFGLVFMIPWLIGFALFFCYPFFHSVWLSLQKVTFNQQGGGYTTAFIGAANYISAITKDENFLPYVSSSLMDLLINTPVCMVFSFFAAVLLKQKFHGNFLVKAVFFLPVILGMGLFLEVQSGGAQNMALESAKQEGVSSMSMLQSINIVHVLEDIGVPSSVTAYITGPVERIYTVISMSGVQIFIFLAGLNAIAPSLYEAAYIEGASGWVAFWKITFPMVSPVMIVNIVYSLIDNFTMSTNVTMNYIQSTAFSQFNYGLSSAMAWIYCVILGVIVGGVMWLLSKRVVYQA